MKKIIAFTRARMLMLVMSALVIIAGGVGTVMREGFNLGIDFTGGVNKQFQVVPVAFTVGYEGAGAARLSVGGGFVRLALTGGEEPRELEFALQNYATIGDLATALRFIDGVSVDVSDGAEGLAASLVMPLSFAQDLGEVPVAVNRRLAAQEPAFAPIDRVREALAGFGDFSLQVVGNPREQQFVLKLQTPEEQQGSDAFLTEVDQRITEALATEFGAGSVVLQRTDFVGSIFSVDLVRGAFWSILVALVLILVYITVRFRFVYALGAVAALVHDVAIMVGVIGAFQLEVTSVTIAAVLTIIGYSLNDTIVVFDRVRENVALMPEADRETVINTSITQSLSRTVITSLTTLLAVIAITVFATGQVRDFSFNLIIGVVVGTYSSIFVASPLVLGWQNAVDRRRRKREGVPVRVGPSRTPEAKVERQVAEPIAAEEREPAPAPARDMTPEEKENAAASAAEIRKEAQRRRSKKRRKKK